ncbi:MAG: TonB-dependent receptor plug domain-containing protein [Gemmatimonadetes bacterium]|nr:TonB-dependent receptor plug domain-containing protein [Gemmatimonadota bacterium]
MGRKAVFLLVAAVVSGTDAGAQIIAPADRTVAGLVRDSISDRPLSGVLLYFDGRPDEYRSGSDGRFRIGNAALHDTVLVVRRVGYVPRRVSVPPSPSAAAVDVGTVFLRPVATELDRIAVEAEEVRLYPHLADFYRRKQQKLPGGTYITREDIQRSGVRRTSEMLQRSPQIQLDCPNQRLGDDACVARNRRARNNPFVNRDPAGADKCEMDVFMDGQRSTQRPDEVPLFWIAGIEMYSGPATTPSVFGNGRCGVIAIWTVGARGG